VVFFTELRLDEQARLSEDRDVVDRHKEVDGSRVVAGDGGSPTLEVRLLGRVGACVAAVEAVAYDGVRLVEALGAECLGDVVLPLEVVHSVGETCVADGVAGQAGFQQVVDVGVVDRAGAGLGEDDAIVGGDAVASFVAYRLNLDLGADDGVVVEVDADQLVEAHRLMTSPSDIRVVKTVSTKHIGVNAGGHGVQGELFTVAQTHEFGLTLASNRKAGVVAAATAGVCPLTRTAAPGLFSAGHIYDGSGAAMVLHGK